MFDFTPESFKKQTETNLRAGLEFNKKIVDWQLEQSKLAEKQLHTVMANTRAMVETSVAAATATQTAMVDAMFPKADKA